MYTQRSWCEERGSADDGVHQQPHSVDPEQIGALASRWCRVAKLPPGGVYMLGHAMLHSVVRAIYPCE